jgi:uncharacterized paraquat-inducible protein A
MKMIDFLKQMERMRNARQGKCDRCKVAYRFVKPKRLRDAACPKCGDKLQAITYTLKRYPWVERENVALYNPYPIRAKVDFN